MELSWNGETIRTFLLCVFTLKEKEVTPGLQQGREEAEEGLDESEVEGATGPVVGADGDAGAEVVHVHPAETFREGTMVHEGVDLKVVLEAAEVEVGGPYAGDFVVRHEELGVQEARAIEVHLDAGPEHVFEVRVRGQVGAARIRTLGKHQAHVHAPERSRLKRLR